MFGNVRKRETIYRLAAGPAIPLPGCPENRHQPAAIIVSAKHLAAVKKMHQFW